MKNLVILLSALFIFPFNQVQAQDTLRGKVINSKRQLLNSAFVVISENTKDRKTLQTELTDNDGQFMYSLPYGTTEVLVKLSRAKHRDTIYKVKVDSGFNLKLFVFKLDLIPVIVKRPDTIRFAKTDTAELDTFQEPGRYYIILGSDPEYVKAYELWTDYYTKIKGLEIIDRENRPYRVGFFAGTKEEDAYKMLELVKKEIEGAWVLSPDSF